MNRPAPAWRAAWVAWAAFIVYGSLVPLDLQPLPWAQAVVQFRQIPWLDLGVQSRADWIANGVLYLPLGALGALALARWRLAGALAAVALAWALALAVEFTQQWFPPRTVSLNDLLAEALGSVAGALLAPHLGRWAAQARDAFLSDLARVRAVVLPAYALLYLLYAFFPYDLLLGRAEWADKLAGANVGWLLARTEDFSWLRAVLQWGAEAAMSVPLGVWLAERTRDPGRGGWRPALLLGALLGLAIELGQLALASGVSQGLSVASRAAGVALGAWAWPHWQAGGRGAVKRWIDRHAGWLVWPWLVLLAVASGWGRHAWGGLERAEASWAETRWQPFYYHYYTTEAIALASVGYVVVMYAPLALLAWARGSAPVAAGLLAALVALFIEAGKLFFAEIHPDPTNLLLAGVAVALLVRAGRLELPAVAVAAPAPAAVPPPTPSPAPATTPAPPRARSWQALLPALPLVALAATWPAVGPLLALGVAAAALATWRQPLAALAIVPMALVVDFAPWSGRFFVDEFDLLFLACGAVAWVRSSARPSHRRVHASTLLFALFGASLALATGKGMAQAAMGWDLNLLSHYHSPLNGLRIAKGALWALLFAALYRRLVGGDPARARWFAGGVGAALAWVLVLVAWERLAFVGHPFDFQADYRVTGPFSAMHKGGAYIECFIAVAAAFVAAEALAAPRAGLRAAAALLLAGAAYAIGVTYSRNGWAAFAWVLAVAAVIGLRRGWGRKGGLAGAALVVTLAAAVALPAATGAFGRARLAQWEQDLSIRAAHWREALSLRDGSLATELLGAGVGRFPEMHFWASREPRAAGFRLEPGEGNPFLRLGTGATVYLDQIVRPPAGQELKVTINVRSSAGAPQLKLVLCRKWMLTSSDCEETLVQGIDKPNVWQTQDATLAPLPAPTSWAEALAPVKLALVTPEKGRAVDVDNASLFVADAPDLLSNGSFAAGMDRWFFATDLDPPWHIHSLPVALLFDQGWLGLLAGAALVLAALAAGARAAWAGSVPGLAAFAGFGAFVVCGSVNTLVDEPRFLFLWLLLAWLACYWRRRSPPASRGRPQGHDELARPAP